MKSFFVFFALLFISVIIGCSVNKNNTSNLPCNKKNDEGKVIRKDKGDTYTLIDSTGLFVYYDYVYASNYSPGSKLYLSSRHKVKAGYFSQTSCGRIYGLNYENIRKLYKKTLPDFVKEVKDQRDRDLKKPFDSTSNIPRINVILKKYIK